ncbi:MAG: phosphate ABC transporter permease PstA [Clostridiales bacterium]|nr:phosphate ABC transporter permease PstA [Clostridiales bacterium]
MPVIGKYFSYAAAVCGIVWVFSIVLFIMIKGLPHIDAQLLFGEFAFGGEPTIASSLAATGMMIAAASLIAFPLGICAAIYLSEYTAKNGRLARAARLGAETLGGIPSIIYGLFGAAFFCNALKMGSSVIAGSLTVSLMIIPTTIRATEEALRAVPNTMREGSFALGGGRLRTVFRVALPYAIPSILSAAILGIGRMTGESAPVLYTMGASLKPMPRGFASGGTTLSVAVYALSREWKYADEAYATACVLIVVILTLNIAAALFASLIQRRIADGARTGPVKSRVLN